MISETKIQERFKQSGLKMTQARLNTFRALHELNHPTVDEIINYYQEQESGTSFQSIYNNLEDFEKVNLVKKISRRHIDARLLLCVWSISEDCIDRLIFFRGIGFR